MTQQHTTSADVVIIGGGIMGTSLAWELAERGVSTLVVERSTVAAGASGRTGALLRQHYSNRPEATLAHLSLQVYRNWSEIVGGSCGFLETGLVVTIPTGPDAEVNVERLKRNVALQQSVGIDTRAISPEELAVLEPGIFVEDIAVASYEASTGCVDAVAATQRMASAAVERGARLLEGCAALAIESNGERITGVQTSLGRISCSSVVCAAGPWSTRLLDPLGVPVPLEALRVQVAVLARPLSFHRSHAAFVDIAAGIFCRPLTSGRTLTGTAGGDQHDPVDPDRYSEQIDRSYPEVAIEGIARRFPAMANAAFLSGHVGLYDMTPDGHPILGPAGPDGLYLMLGFSGAGFKKGPAVGQAMAEQITDGRSSLVDLAPFRWERFTDGRDLAPWSEDEYVLSADFGHRF